MTAAPASRTTHQDTIWTPSTPLRHMPQLDGLRALAAGMVVCYHFWRPARQYVHLGGIGVRVFFVLSGFLITGILLRSRLGLDAGRTPAGVALRHFYIRRVLRIFPLYYLALVIAWFGKVSGAREGMLWHAGYLSNVHFFLVNAVHHGAWGGHVGHFWSLAVEEQFYLVWPWVILFARRRWLPGIALSLVALGPIFRFVVFTLTGNDITPVLPLGCIDSLALGAYLAMTVLPEFESHPLIRPIGASALWSGLLLFAIHQAAVASNGFWRLRIVVFDLAVALVGVWLVARASRGMGGPAGRFLQLAPVRYLGTISYGIYVYHAMLPELLPKLARRLGYPDLLAPLGDQTLPFLFFYAAASIAVAAVSWHAFEGPLNRLKARFEYR
ncbi:MAG TPA: acyltransferase [Gemmatimonadales bacterium]|jgi:peptidoglycan/LPS O-acetylase OafA/YrhL|nr:acyltransferase [Gemmatimonadales bacterium]